MARKPRITNEEILASARAVFLQHGYSTPTAEIARVAGISEGTLFKRFDTKDDLFFACMGVTEPPSWMGALHDAIGEGEVRDNLREMMVSAIGFLQEMWPRIMMIWSCRRDPRSPHPSLDGGPAPPLRAVRAIADYLEAEQRLGRLACGDAQVAARTLLGAAAHFALWQLVGLNEEGGPDAACFSHGVVDLVWQGLEPRESP